MLGRMIVAGWFLPGPAFAYHDTIGTDGGGGGGVPFDVILLILAVVVIGVIGLAILGRKTRNPRSKAAGRKRRARPPVRKRR